MTALARQRLTKGSVIETVVPLGGAYPDVLALGAFLKNTVCAIRGDAAYVAHGIGDLDSPSAIDEFEDVVASLVAETGVRPVRVAHDLHPDFHSTRFAKTLGAPTLAVQHHHAHAAAVMAEHKICGPVVALALDGFGLGPANQSWGGELLWTDGARYRRLGHLSLLRQPGGDVAARQPWRMGAAALHALGRGHEIADRFGAHAASRMLGGVLERGLNSPHTSSCGRLFDAACGLLDVRPVADFEGQAPMDLEALADAPAVLAGGWSIDADGVLDMRPLLAALTTAEPRQGANVFHGTLAAALAEWAQRAVAATGAAAVVLGGGCFFNAVLRRLVGEGLAKAGIKAFAPVRLSPGDPAISVGQALVAALTAEKED